MNIPQPVIFVLETIQKAGGQAWLVGGAVRDLLLGRAVPDFDIATTLDPDTTERLFTDFYPYTVGKRFGTISIIIDGKPIEITTLRGEGSYTDSRHPDEVYFISDIESDLARRDFTINAMAYNPLIQDEIIDPFHGRKDLSDGVIRAVGDPIQRFSEDPLRMLRAIRLASQLDFQIDKKTENAIARLHSMLCSVAKERIKDEFSKLLISPYPITGLNYMETTGALNMILPSPVRASLTPAQLRTIARIKSELTLRLAAVFCYLYPDVDAADISEMLKKLKYSNAEAMRAAGLQQGYACLCSNEVTAYHLRRLIGELGDSDTLLLIEWHMAEAEAAGDEAMYDKCSKAGRLYSTIVQNREPVHLKDLAITGNDIIAAGIGTENRELVGEALRLAYDWVLHSPDLNNRQYLISELKKKYAVN